VSNFYILEGPKLVATGSCVEADLGLMAQHGQTLVVGNPPPESLNAPSPYHWFNFTTQQWVDPRQLGDFKRIQWGQIKQQRAAAEGAGFECDGCRYDSDAVSQQRISGAVQLAMMSPTFSIGWTLEDDTTVTLDAAGMAAVGIALGVHVQTVFAKGQALRTAIDAATTREDVEAVTW